MKNKLLFMMLTILGAPGIAAAAGYDLANSEYNFAVNELSKSSFNQAAIIGQAGTNNSAQLRQGGSKLLAVVAQEGSSNRAKIDQTGDYNLAYIDQAGSANDALMNPLMILVKIIKLRWIHILSYDQMVSRK
ncbi:curli minor subunit CsgB, partial [Escherichia coli]